MAFYTKAFVCRGASVDAMLVSMPPADNAQRESTHAPVFREARNIDADVNMIDDLAFDTTATTHLH